MLGFTFFLVNEMMEDPHTIIGGPSLVRQRDATVPLRTSCDRGYPGRQHLCAWLSGNPLYSECHFIGFRLFRLSNFVTLLVPCSRYNYLLELFLGSRVHLTVLLL